MSCRIVEKEVFSARTDPVDTNILHIDFVFAVVGCTDTVGGTGAVDYREMHTEVPLLPTDNLASFEARRAQTYRDFVSREFGDAVGVNRVSLIRWNQA